MKKPAAIQISIPEPCTQAWDEMQPAQGGRHCAHCQKVVVDFTRMTDAQLLDYFKINDVGCGRLRNEQIGINIKEVKEARKIWFPKIAAGLLLILGLSKSAEAQMKKGRPQIAQKNAGTKPPTVAKQRLKEVTVKAMRGYEVPIIDSNNPAIKVLTGQVYQRSEPDAQYKKMPVEADRYLLKTPVNTTEYSVKAYHSKRTLWRRLQFWRK